MPEFYSVHFFTATQQFPTYLAYEQDSSLGEYAYTLRIFRRSLVLLFNRSFERGKCLCGSQKNRSSKVCDVSYWLMVCYLVAGIQGWTKMEECAGILCQVLKIIKWKPAWRPDQKEKCWGRLIFPMESKTDDSVFCLFPVGQSKLDCIVTFIFGCQRLPPGFVDTISRVYLLIARWVYKEFQLLYFSVTDMIFLTGTW